MKTTFIVFGKNYTKLEKIRPFFGLGVPPVTGGKSGQIESLGMYLFSTH